MAGAFDGALAAGQADGLVDVGEIVRHGDRAGRADLLTDSAADAADLTHPPRVLAGIFVGALDGDGVRAFVDADELTRAFAHAFAAGDALVLVDLGHAVFIQGDGLEFAYVHAQLAADAAVLALCRGAAAAIAGDKGRLIGEAFFDSHLTFPSFHTACWQAGALCGAHRHSGNRRRQWRARWGSM